MSTDVAARKARLETLLQRVQANRVRLGGPPVAPHAPLPEDDEPLTNELADRAPVAEPPARTIPVPPLEASRAPAAAPAPLVWEGEDEDIEMEIVGEASSEEALLGTMERGAVAPPPPPPLPSTTVFPTAAAEAAAPAETLPASIRIESPPPLDASPIAVVGTVALVAPPSIGALLRASILPPGKS
ncbi:MAG: hypothetical protein JXB32_03040 [Deltaproteobacteria bacterium]|nr:hypothetical protein [Deltaproteobacteria bacterium]